jgi:RNA polymerase sigma-70 factor (ECF subfamily)
MMERGLASPAADSRTTVPPPLPEEVSDARLLERFVHARDGDAFAELVRRHGPMVLGVCRRVLRDREDAQDAFQVTFLVLARKATSVGQPELLANWLYGVAYRTAVRVRERVARRQFHERQSAAMLDPADPPPADTREVLAVLDEELEHLPEMYRTLIVLCYLEGKTHQQAACQLDLPVGSVSWRMNRAKELLHRRLTRRGLALSAAVFGLLLSGQRAAAAAVAGGLAENTTRAAVGFAGGTPDAVPDEHAALTEEVLGGLDKARLGRVTRLLVALLLGLLAGGGLLAGAAVASRTLVAAPAAPEPVPEASSGDECGAH